MLSYVAKHSKQRKTTKPIKLQWIASIGCQNYQNKAKLQKWSISNDLHRFDLKTINNVEVGPKTFKTTQNYKIDQNPMNCIDWMSKLSKQSKTTKVINIQRLASIWRQNDQKCWVTSQNIQNNAKLQNRSNYNDLLRLDFKMIKTNLNYISDQNPMTCIDLTSKRSIMLSLVPKHSKQRKTTKPIKLQWIASIGCQNYQNKAKLQKWSISKDLHRFDVKTIKNVELRRKTFKTTQNYKTDQITMNCIDWMSKQSKQAKLQKWSISNDLHRFHVKTIKNDELRRKTFKTTQNYKTDHFTMTCIDWISKWSKQI